MVGFFELTQINVNNGTNPRMTVNAANVAYVHEANGVTVVGFVGGQDVRVREPYEAVAELLQHHCEVKVTPAGTKLSDEEREAICKIMKGWIEKDKSLPVGIKELPIPEDKLVKVPVEPFGAVPDHKPATRSKR